MMSWLYDGKYFGVLIITFSEDVMEGKRLSFRRLVFSIMK